MERQEADIERKAEQLSKLLEDLADEDVIDAVIDRRTDVEREIAYFTEPDGDEMLFRDVLDDIPRAERCRCPDLLCPVKRGDLPVRVERSDRPLLEAFRRWEASHAGCDGISDRIQTARAEARERALRGLSQAHRIGRHQA